MTTEKIPGAEKKVSSGVCGILLGGFGVHRFILDDATGGILRILITVCTCGAGSVIGLIEGIIYLTKSDEDFVQTYIVEKKAWFQSEIDLAQLIHDLDGPVAAYLSKDNSQVSYCDCCRGFSDFRNCR